MSSESEQDSMDGLLSDSEISELDLLDERGEVDLEGASTDGDDDDGVSDYDSDSQYTPSEATTADFDFLDDSSSDELSASGNSYQPESGSDIDTSDSSASSMTDSSVSSMTDSSVSLTTDSSSTTDSSFSSTTDSSPTADSGVSSTAEADHRDFYSYVILAAIRRRQERGSSIPRSE